MKMHFTARELAGLPGLPATEAEVIALAEREGWPWRLRAPIPRRRRVCRVRLRTARGGL